MEIEHLKDGGISFDIKDGGRVAMGPAFRTGVPQFALPALDSSIRWGMVVSISSRSIIPGSRVGI